MGKGAPAKTPRGDPLPWLRRLFAAIDARDTARFLEFLTEDATFRFGNQPALKGRAAIAVAVQGFFDSIQACRHEVAASWKHPDSVVCHGQVTYTRADGKRVTVPFANVMLTRGELVRDYLIFVDVAVLFGP